MSDPLLDLHVRIGAVIGAPCGVDVPLSYGDPAAEHRAVRGAVGIVDRSQHGVLEVTGKDRVSFLNGMLTNDIKALGPGRGCAAAFLDARGRVQALLAVLALTDRVLLVVPPGLAAKTLEALERFHFAEQLEIRDASDEFVMLMLAGPATAGVIERLAAASLPESPWQHVETPVAGAPARLVRGGGGTGATEAWFLAARAGGPALFEAILAAGAAPVGLSALDVLRVEAGTPWFGHDVDDSVLLPEMPFEKLVSYTKGCYIGQELVVRVRDRGHVNRLLTGLILDGDVVPRSGARVVVDGREAGRITSAVRSFSLGRPIALVFVRREHATPGTPVGVVDDGHDLAARVAALPFVAGA